MRGAEREVLRVWLEAFQGCLPRTFHAPPSRARVLDVDECSVYWRKDAGEPRLP